MYVAAIEGVSEGAGGVPGSLFELMDFCRGYIDLIDELK